MVASQYQGYIMDLSKVQGLTAEQLEAIKAAHDKSVEGLKTKNEQLLGEKKTVQATAAEQAQIAEDARQAAVRAEEERLKASKDVEGLKSHYETQLAEKTAEANEAAEAAKNALLQRDKGSTLNQVKSLIHEDFRDLAEANLSNMLNISYNDQQQPIATFTHNGEVVANNIDEFKGWASEQDSFKKILKGVNSSGAGTTRTGAASGKPMTLTEKAIAMNKDPNAKF